MRARRAVRLMVLVGGGLEVGGFVTSIRDGSPSPFSAAGSLLIVAALAHQVVRQRRSGGGSASRFVRERADVRPLDPEADDAQDGPPKLL